MEMNYDTFIFASAYRFMNLTVHNLNSWYRKCLGIILVYLVLSIFVTLESNSSAYLI